MLKNEKLDDLLYNKNYKFYAHTRESSSEKELLSAHLKLTYKYYEKMEKEKDLDKKVKKLVKTIFKVDDKKANLGYQLFKSAIYYHDIGKINPLFQKNKMNNELNLKAFENKDTHSALSARLFIDGFLQEMKDIELVTLLFMFAYIISRHHSNIGNINDFYKELEYAEEPQLYKNNVSYEKCKKIIFDGINPFLRSGNIDEISIYILMKLLYSCLVTADFYATYEYMTQKQVKMNFEKDNLLFKKYEDSDLYKTIRRYENKQTSAEGINILRNEMFLETEHTLKENLNSNIYYLEAPTGAGKTNMAINLARLLYEQDDNIKSINYIFPFNAIVEQTQNTFKKYFEEYNDFSVINSITGIVKDINEDVDYDSVYIKNSFRQYKIVITSHINLFNTLFGEGKEHNYSLYNYVNSIVVLDEIQSYPNKKWRQMIEMFNKYAEMLNIKFIIMSATLPRLDKLLKNSNNKFTALISNTDKYYKNPIFKNRVSVDYSLLEKRIELTELANEVLKNKGKKVLVECIKKKTANKLYEILKNKSAENVFILTGDDNSYYRKKLIEKINNCEDIILVTTQTIEAGVDIDMDIGYKDISFLDNEEQFLGRINRSCKKKNCKAFFFNYDSAETIYREDNRIGLDVSREDIREYLDNKDFIGFYNKVIDRVEYNTEKYNKENISNLFDACKYMNFTKIEKIMRLIENETIELFLNYDIEVDGNIINGKNVFEEYKRNCKDSRLSYAKKKIIISKINERLNLFLYTIYKSEQSMISGDKFGSIYYIEDGEKYMINGRFNRELFLSKGDSLFI